MKIERPPEPIAIIGMACRFPGAPDLATFWQLLVDGREAIGEVPGDRFDIEAFFDPEPGTPGKICSRLGGFLEGIDLFDAAYFGISPREADRMDPQQRLLLEVSREALDDAGQGRESFEGSATGVFVGLGSDDYREMGFRERQRIDLYLNTGGARGVAAGRISHAFKLRGPSLAVDSDRSASLVAVHLACQSLRAGECGMALAGGANLVLRPEPGIAFSMAGLLAPDGRCKAFDAAADGFVRSDGVGVVVLKPLAAALADGDPVAAVIRGSAVNCDGGRGALMAPSREGQEEVLRAAYADAGLAPGEVHYVETHGTGTPVGDVVEAQALGAVMAEGRPPGSPCLIGSVKSNIGHAEAAAGVAGLIKAALILGNRLLPASLHCHEPSTEIPWQELAIAVQRELRPLPLASRPARVGVSSFGIAGTNAHVVLEEVDAELVGDADAAADSAHLLTMSAASRNAVLEQGRRWRDFLGAQGGPGDSLANICFTAALRRSHYDHRLAVVARDRWGLIERLAAYEQGETRSGLSSGMPSAEGHKVVFVFSGQGSQWLGMGRQLAAAEPVFRSTLEDCDRVIRDLADWSVLDELHADERHSRLAEVDVVQPMIFALQVALAALWRSWGLEPDAVVGQSLGEAAAAHVAGALGLEDAARVMVQRSRIVKRTAGRGAMALVELSPDAAREALTGYADVVGVAGNTSPTSSMLSGEPAALEKILARLEEREVFCRRVNVDYASHCPQMDPLLDDLRESLDGISARRENVPMCSTVTANLIPGRELGAGYWARNLRQPVRFSESVLGLVGSGHEVFVEVSPHPILLASLRALLRHRGREGMVLPSLRRNEADREVMLGSLGALWTVGCCVDLEPVFGGGRCVALPAYPWQRNRHWFDEGTRPIAAVEEAATQRHERGEAVTPTDLAALAPEERRSRVGVEVRRHAAAVLGMSPAALDPEVRLTRLGLDSLMAVELRHRLEKGLGAQVSAARLLAGLDVAGLERQVLKSVETVPSADDLLPTSPAGEPSELPLSPGQKALWFLHRLAPESTAYNLAFVLRVLSPLDLDALRHAFTTLVERHAALRTTFHAPGGRSFQRIHETMEVALLAEQAEDWSLAQLQHRVQREAYRPFDLEEGPLLRAAVFSRGPEEHVLVLAMHHIITDLWSVGILMHELGVAYAAALGDPGARLDSVAADPGDYLAWQLELLTGAEGERLRSYWASKLAAPLPELQLPIDRPRPPVQTYRGAAHSVVFDALLSERLLALTRDHETTLFTTLLTALQVLLSRITGQEDILVGSPMAGRSRAKHAEMVGYLVNPVVLRADLSGNPRFAELLARTRETVLEAMDHQDYPFQLLVEHLQPVRDPSRSPIFQVMFALEKAPRPELQALAACAVGRRGATMEVGGLIMESHEIEVVAAQFDLNLMMAEVDGRLAASMTYNSDLFDSSTVRRLLGHLQVVLEAVVDDPARRLLDLPLASAAELHQVLVEWSDTGAELGGGANLVQLIEAQVARTPEKEAVVFDGRRLSYDELSRKANRLARRLMALGVAPEARVGVCLERSLEMVVGLLAVLKAGGAYVPLDPEFPPSRLAFIAQDSGVRVLVSKGSLADRVPVTGVELVLVDDEVDGAGAFDHHPIVEIGAANLAYVTYTSGSTGRPKGVQISHRSLVNFLESMACEPGMSARDTLLALTTISFDISGLELFLPLIKGARVVVASRDQATDPIRLAELVRDSGATVMQATPATWRLLLETGWAGEPELTLLCGGEALPGALAAELYPRGKALWNLYGPTETTIWSTLRQVASVPGAHVVAIGRPIANTTAYILDRALNPVTIGVTGELYIGGAGLARGYLGRPELTAESFVPDPFGSEPGGRLYRTGDLVRHRANGELEYLGRADHQVKVHGFRIELGEVEAVLERHPAVEAAAVLALGEREERRLVAYVASAPRAGTEALSVSGLRAALAEELPEYMVPSAFVQLDGLPLTPSGKVDRRALPEPERLRPELEGAYQAPSGPVESILAEVWANVLQVERVGVHDNFFDLGGDSIRSIQIVVQAGERGIRLSPKDLFARKTVAGLAAVSGIERAIRADQGLVTGSVPVIPTQRWLFAHHPREPWHFNQAVLLELAVPTSPALLERAVEALLHHHDALRLRFEREGEAWKQVNAGFDGTVPLTRIDLTRVSSAAVRSAVDVEVSALDAWLDLAAGPLLRASLFETGPQRPDLLLIVVHQLAVDGPSWKILLEDLETTCAQLAEGEVVALPAKTAAFKSWAEAVAAAERQDPGRRSRLEVSEAQTRLPEDVPGGANSRASADTVTVSLSNQETMGLFLEARHAYGLEASELLLTALSRSIDEWSGNRGVLVDLEWSWRNLVGDADVSRTVGCFSVPLPFLLCRDGRVGAGPELKAVKERMREPRRRVSDLSVEAEIEGSGTPVRPQVSFRYVDRFDPEASHLFSRVLESPSTEQGRHGSRRYVLEVDSGVRDGCLRCRFTFSANLHRPSTIRSLAASFLEELRVLIAHCREAGVGGYTPSDFPLAGLSQSQVDRFFGADRAVEDVYPLSPMQEGMLFHTLYSEEWGVYFEQLSWQVNGAVDPGTLRRAAQLMVDRHPILRTVFVWHGLSTPLQVVRREVELQWQEHDWTGLSEEETTTRLESLLEEDKHTGFDLGTAPLFRLALVHLAEGRWRLLWSHHHLLLDGWSIEILHEELLALYVSVRNGREMEKQTPRPFRDFIAWLAEQDLRGAETHWRKTLAGFSAPTPLAMERSEGRCGESSRRSVERLRMPAREMAALQAFAPSHRLTVNTMVQGAWAQVMSLFAGEEDVLFGVTSSGRPTALAGADSMVGLFINTLPMRVAVRGHEAVVPWLKGIQDQHVELRQYEFTPLVKVHGWSDVARQQQLFESILVFENYPIKASMTAQAGMIELTDLCFLEQSNYPLTVIAVPGRELLLEVSYDPARFDRAAMRRILGLMRTLLNGMVAEPDGALGSLALLDDRERHRIVVELNDTAGPELAVTSLQELIEQQVERAPNAIAVSAQGQQWSYDELNRWANRLARRLLERGVVQETVVALSLERSPRALVALLATLKAGGAFLPVDPEYPGDRRRFMLSDAAVELVVADGARAGELAGAVDELIDLDIEWESIAALDDTNPGIAIDGDSLAYVIYTSGSTGLPKGVQLQHRGLANLVLAQGELFDVHPGDRVLSFAALSFDAAVAEIGTALAAGATLVMAPRESLRPGPELLETLVDEAISTVTLPPSSLNVLGEHALPDLRTLIVAGEACPAELVARWSPGRRFVNAYGPTETTVCATAGVCSPAPLRPSIGRPINNFRVYILDGFLRPVPVGVAGELCVGGVGVARGYLGRPGLTAERFVPDPFSESPGARIYRTGDLAVYEPDGTIFCLGRIDDQVKVRGFRIEPGEIEAALLRHAGVREAAVVVQGADASGASGSERLVAFVTAAGEQAPAAEELRTVLEASLPEHMVPSVFEMTERLPLTPSGKIDRKALARRQVGRPRSGRVLVPPRNPIEEIIAGAFAEVLGVGQVGAHDSFFELGGHSLLATQVVSRLDRALRTSLEIRELFEHPTVAGLAAAVGAADAVDGTSEICTITAGPRDEEPPLSFAQQRLWFLDRLEPGTSVYNIPVAFRIEGRLEVEALRWSLEEVLRRHEALRTTFPAVDGQPVQAIAPAPRLDLETVDLSDLELEDREIAARRAVHDAAWTPFDLASGPLYRFVLLRLSSEEHLLAITLHHIVADGWSMGVLFSELKNLYRSAAAAAAGEQPISPLQDVEIHYADFAVWQRGWLQGPALEAQLDYWRGQLVELTPLELTPDRARPAVQTFSGAAWSFTIPERVKHELATLALGSGASLYMVLLSAFMTLLSRFTGEQDVAVGSPIANRNRREIEGLIGFFVNTLVMRGDLGGDPTFSELVDRVREAAMSAYANQDVPFERLVEELSPKRDLSRNPLFSVLFAFQNTQVADLGLDDLLITPLELDWKIVRFDLELHLWPSGRGLGGVFLYNTDLYDRTTVARLCSCFEVLLEGIAAAPEQRLSRLPIMTPAQRQQVLVEWNASAQPAAAECIAHRLFEAEAQRRPDATAVVMGERRLSYAELDEAAERRAWQLARLYVGPDVPVAVAVDRSPEMIVAVLAVLKAGGVYVPLDPCHPRERLAVVLADCRAAVVLTESCRVDDLPENGATVICVDRWLEVDGDGEVPARTDLVSPGPDHLAYVIYTSGSTGRPKGVAMRHGALANLIAWQLEHCSAGAGDRTLNFASLSFDVSFQEIFSTFASGGTLVLVGDEMRRDPTQLLAYLDEERISRLFLPFVALQQLAEVAVLRRAAPGSLVEVITAGEQLRITPEIRTFLSRLPECSLANHYGPSESHVVTAFDLEGAPGEWPVLPSIGRPIAETAVYILDRALQPAPPGAPGELFIGGVALARGYLGRPELTARSFLPDPFAASAGARMYRTGDLARHRPDGSIDFLGRIDHQVKIRGFRVEPGEVEANLELHPGVREAVVVAKQTGSGERRLVAYVLGDDEGAPVEPVELREWLRGRLPDCMVPSALVPLASLPLTASGKVDRKSLPEAEDLANLASGAAVAPRNAVERGLAELWTELLGVAEIGVADDFFELGGHSLLAVRLMVQVERRFAVRLPLTQLFREPTLAGLARAITEDRPAETPSNLVEIRAASGRPALYLVHPGGGNVICYSELAGGLSGEQPIFGLQSSGIDDDEPFDSDVPGMASRYLEAIRVVQPHGPYRLGGWSLGGVVAYEMAVQARSVGEDVALLVLIDSTAPRPDHRFDLESMASVDFFAGDLGLPVAAALSGEEAAVEDRARTLDDVLTVYPDLEPDRLEHLYALFRNNVSALADYRPQPFAGPLVLIVPEDRPAEPEPGAAHGWSALVAGGVEVYTVPGDHFTMLRKPHVAEMATIMADVLERAGRPVWQDRRAQGNEENDG